MFIRLICKKPAKLSLGKERLFHASSVLCSSAEREYLHETRIPTYHFQRSLPRLPVPALEKTCERYLRAQEPLLTSSEHNELQKVVADFKSNQGQELHQELLAFNKKNSHTSYVTDLWFDMYLKDRRPLVLTHNPYITFENDPRPEYCTQLIRAANMLISSTRCLKTLRDKKLEPEVFHLNPKKSNTDTFRTVSRLLPSSLSWYGAYLFKAFPLDMSQYQRLFNSCRIPRPEKDELYTDEDSKHIVVLRNGNIYMFDMLDRDGNIISESDVLSHLSYILNDNTPPPEFPVTTLTSEFRDVWTRARVQLINADPDNEIKLRLIQGAFFALCLDDYKPDNYIDMGNNFLYGDGVNRWFDKSFQLIIDQNGSAAVHFEHAWGDGVAVLRYFNEVFKDSTEKSKVHPNMKPSDNANSARRVQRLDFTLDPFIKDTIRKAKERFDEATGSLDSNFLNYEGFNKKLVKKTKLSPDSVMQLVIQMAHYRMHGKHVGTYESCSTSAFKHGRTETVRPCTVATKAMCDRLYGKAGPQGSVEDMLEALRQCSTVHSQLTKEAALGQGFDRHLFFLKHLAEMKNWNVPMFTHPAYKNINHIILSTSTLSSPAVMIGGFAAVTPDGFGIGYTIEDKRLGLIVSAYPACSVGDFLACAESSLDDVRDIMQGRQPSCKPF